MQDFNGMDVLSTIMMSILAERVLGDDCNETTSGDQKTEQLQATAK